MNTDSLSKLFTRLANFAVATMFIVAYGRSAAQDPPQTETKAETTQVELLLAQANDFSQRKDDRPRALALYEEALALESGNDEILWRMSRVYFDIAEHLPAGTDEEKEKQLAMYEKALEFADKSIEVNQNSSMAYTRRAVANGRIVLSKGMWSSIGLLKEMRNDLEKAIAIDSLNHQAYYALGRTHMRVIERPFILRWPLGLGWGSRSEAMRNFERAVALRGDVIPYRLEYARACADEEQLEKAREQLTMILTLPALGEDDEQYRKEAKELLERLKHEE